MKHSTCFNANHCCVISIYFLTSALFSHVESGRDMSHKMTTTGIIIKLQVPMLSQEGSNCTVTSDDILSSSFQYLVYTRICCCYGNSLRMSITDKSPPPPHQLQVCTVVSSIKKIKNNKSFQQKLLHKGLHDRTGGGQVAARV